MGIRERKKADTRRALVDAASELFAERGVQATTMDDIAEAAGMSRTSVFNYFGHKEMILCEIGARTSASRRPLQGRDRPIPEAFGAVTDALAELASRQPALIAAVAREPPTPTRSGGGAPGRRWVTRGRRRDAGWLARAGHAAAPRLQGVVRQPDRRPAQRRPDPARRRRLARRAATRDRAIAGAVHGRRHAGADRLAAPLVQLVGA